MDAALTTKPPRTRRSKIIGSIIAVLVMAGLGGLAWYLTQQPKEAGGGPGAAAAALSGADLVFLSSVGRDAFFMASWMLSRTDIRG